MMINPTRREYWDWLIAWTQSAEFSARVAALSARIENGEPVTLETAAEFLSMPYDVFLDSIVMHMRRRQPGAANTATMVN